ncbi:MAG: tetratricopeptide repeat protein, partial [Phaeodactylibacter sp.]|nr:tetratricopeptide repeat protein [Phaeodactylibacter sp.]
MRTYFIFALLLSGSGMLWCQPSGLPEAAQYQNRAASQLLNGDVEGAILELETAASLYESAQQWEYYFSCLNQVTNAYLSIGKMEEAKRTAKKALWQSIERLGRDNDEAAKAAHRLAEVYSRAGRHPKAMEVHKMGLMIRESIYGSRHVRIADSYDWIARAWAAAGDYGKAADYYERAMNLRKDLLGAEHPDIATSYTNLASLELARRNYPQALAHYQTAYRISRGRLGEKHPDVASALASMAHINRLLGQEELAEQQYREAALLYRGNPDAKGEQVAKAFYELAIQYFDTGKLNAASGFAKRAVRALAFGPGQDQEYFHRYYQLLGAILMEMGQYKEAAINFRHALGSEKGASAANYQQWVEALRLSGNLPVAIDAANTFLEWAKGEQDPSAMLNARTQLGSLLIENSRIEEGIQQLTAVLNHANTPFWLLQEANFSLADASRRKGAYELAIQNYKQLAMEWEQSQHAGALFFHFKALLAIGETHCKLALQDRNALYNLEAALNAFRACDKILINLIRSPLPSEQLTFLLRAQTEFYNNAISTCYGLYQQNLEKGYLEEAFYFSERSKQWSARLPLLLLPPASFAQAPQSLLKKEAACKLAVQRLFRTLKNSRFQEGVTDSLQNEIEKQEAGYRAVLDELEQRAPHYYRLKFGGEPVSPAALKAMLKQQSAVLYSYYIDEENLYVFYFSGDGFQLFRWPMDELFRTGLQTFLQMIVDGPEEGPAGQSKETYQKVSALAVQLYGKLLPGKPGPPGQQIFLLPHGKLQWLPFDALAPTAPAEGDFTSLSYLGLNYNLSYHSSATALKNAMDWHSAGAYESPFDAFLWTEHNSQVAMKGAYSLNSNDNSPLAFFLAPARNWAIENNGQLWDGPMARESIFRERPPAEVLLLALPVRAGSSFGDTFVYFSEKADSLADNRLYLKEAYGIKKPAALYILPSVLPQSMDHSAWQPLAEALEYSGCQSLLLHRWPTTGQPSAELLQLFLGRWKATGSTPESLMEAR